MVKSLTEAAFTSDISGTLQPHQQQNDYNDDENDNSNNNNKLKVM
jgi:hypothetical protein